MNDKILASYTFLPWLRQGLVSKITRDDTLGNMPGRPERASVLISLGLEAKPKAGKSSPDTAPGDVQIVGPGDVIGINPQAIIRTEPRDWITDFEPNYLAFVEFYDEDFPWRYTPARAVQLGGGVQETKLRPWIFLMVLKEEELDSTTAQSGVLPVVRLNDGADANSIFPPFCQAWAWAHVHVSRDITAGNKQTPAQTVQALEGLLRHNSDYALSRLVCPRKLEPLTGYHAFVIPAFEVGRRAGLGESTEGLDAQAPSWGVEEKEQDQREYPVYYQWYFRTGERGDFEYLVGLLDPGEADERVGVRDMDMQDPGFDVKGMKDGPSDEPVMGLEGALRSPKMLPRPVSWPPRKRADYPEFLRQLERQINLQDALLKSPPDVTNRHPDPIVLVPPLYGRWHAMQSRLDADQRGWVNELNRDPRYRVAAGFGTQVIQTGQEAYVQKAWQQLGAVLEANQQIRQAQLALTASHCLYEQSFQALSVDQQIAVTQPVHSRILGENHTTIFQQVKQSRLPLAALNPAFRRILRPGGPVMRKAMPENRGFPNIPRQLNEGEITAAPPKELPEKAISINIAIDQTMPVPQWLRPLLDNPSALWIPLLLLLLPLGLVFMVGIAVLGILGFAEGLRRLGPKEKRDQYIRRTKQTLRAMLSELRQASPAPWYAGSVSKLLELMLMRLERPEPGLRNIGRFRQTLLDMRKDLRRLRPKGWYIRWFRKFLLLPIAWLKLIQPTTWRWYIAWLRTLSRQTRKWLRTAPWNIDPILKILRPRLNRLRQLEEKPWYIDLLSELLQLVVQSLERLQRGQWPSGRLSQLLLRTLVALCFVAGINLILITVSAMLLTDPKLAKRLIRRSLDLDDLREENLTTGAVDDIPPRPGFFVTEPGEALPPDTTDPNRTDSEEATNFRTALFDLFGGFEIDLPQPELKPPLDFEEVGASLAEALDPTTAITNRARSIITNLGLFAALRPVETIVPVMAHPVFADPMAKPLLKISHELLIPNLDLITNNTITLLQTNPKFIEAYMVGVNHEMARELLWREYPTDQRGSYFRQFWEVSDIVNRDGKNAKELEEELRDIEELHMWVSSSALGKHENRDLPTGGESEDGSRLVLVVRGDLLKKYPTAVIYAQRARFSDPHNPDRPRELDQGDPKPIKTPTFKLEIEPDLRFLGFDLTRSAAKGDAADPAGWFFVIQERPGEPRFGLDIEDTTPPVPTEWNKLAWNHLKENVASIKFIDLTDIPFTSIPPENPDSKIQWGANAADMAYILYQAPVMAAIHADKMLP